MPSAIRTTIWEIEPHTLAKHAILREYLGAWFPIISKFNQRVVYLDGFCGPGEYKGGEPGSPIVALEVANFHNKQNTIAKEVLFWFSDENSERIAHLRALL